MTGALGVADHDRTERVFYSDERRTYAEHARHRLLRDQRPGLRSGVRDAAPLPGVRMSVENQHSGPEPTLGTMMRDAISELEAKNARLGAMSDTHQHQEQVLEIREALGCAALGDYSQIDLGHAALDSLEEQLETALAALREIAYPETRERKDAGIVLARQALKRLESSPASSDVHDNSGAEIAQAFAAEEAAMKRGRDAQRQGSDATRSASADRLRDRGSDHPDSAAGVAPASSPAKEPSDA